MVPHSVPPFEDSMACSLISEQRDKSSYYERASRILFPYDIVSIGWYLSGELYHFLNNKKRLCNLYNNYVNDCDAGGDRSGGHCKQGRKQVYNKNCKWVGRVI